MNALNAIASAWYPGRLDAIREAIREQNLDGFVVPRWDRAQFEYVTPENERLAWLTGFTGSWGLAIVTLESVILFVDGRYTLQAQRETNCEFITIEHLYDAPPEDWLKAQACRGWKVGYDKEILTPDLYQRLNISCLEKGASLVAASKDPFRSAWKQRPEETSFPVIPQSAAWAGEDVESKLARVREEMSALGADWLVETQPDNVNWLLNIRGNDLEYCPVACARLLLSASGPVHVFVNASQINSIRNLDHWAGSSDVQFHADGDFLSVMQNQFAVGQRLLVDPVQGPQGACDIANNAEAKVRLHPSPITDLKAVKNAVELAAIRGAALADSLVWIRLLYWLEKSVEDRHNLTELSVEQKIHQLRKEISDYAGPSFRSISAANGNAALSHYVAPQTGGAAIDVNTVFLLDSGGQFKRGGTTDTTRTWCFAPPPDHVVKASTTVMKSHIALARQVFPVGTFGHALDAIARAPMWAQGLNYDHGTGHGVGHYLSVHEFPQRLQKAGSPFPLKAGMTITNEPAFYQAGEFGVRHENLCEIVAKNTGWLGLKPLVFVPFNRQLIDAGLLSDEERTWIDRYHFQVWEKFSSELDCTKTREWLKEKTERL